ncbi:MAG: 8-oxo-dGTP diphosphatase [Lachnospiraceae bacterium]|nr:8-oxo-dGTP diphosphatase [Lachnospiraceae bacterium]
MRPQPELTTLCYIDNGESYLMLHRVSKENDINKDKYIGVGGHIEINESPEDCLIREVKEETGLTLNSFSFRGIVTFVSGDGVCEYMALYTASDFSGELIDCDEGELIWIPKSKLHSLNLWEGDHIFLDLLLKGEPFFSLKLVYDGDGGLVEVKLNGKNYKQ